MLQSGKPVAVSVKTGLTDGTSTEILPGDLHEGDDVVTDSTDPSATPATPSAGGGSNPFRRGF